MRSIVGALVVAAAASSWGAGAGAQDNPAAWSQTAARGMLQICLEDQPDAARVGEHAEIWGWPPFKGYLEHPDGYRRQAGGESRRDFSAGDQTAFVEATVQSGVVTSAAPADVRYFHCNIDSDRAINADLESYLAELFGAPALRDGTSVVWLDGAAKGSAATEDAALKAVSAGAPGSAATLIVLQHANGHDEAKLTILRQGPSD